MCANSERNMYVTSERTRDLFEIGAERVGLFGGRGGRGGRGVASHARADSIDAVVDLICLLIFVWQGKKISHRSLTIMRHGPVTAHA